MTLRHEPDVSRADWFVHADAPWQVLATQGPPGFQAYAAIRFDVGESETCRSDDAIMALVVEVAAGHTRTPDDVIFGLWDGWGELTDAGRVYHSIRATWLRDLWFRPSPPRIRPAFDAAILDGPVVDLAGARSYLLFRGPARDVGDWGARPYETDLARTLPPASITWPSDRAWFIAADVDEDRLCVGGTAALVDALIAHPGLDAEPIAHGAVEPGRHDEA